MLLLAKRSLLATFGMVLLCACGSSQTRQDQPIEVLPSEPTTVTDRAANARAAVAHEGRPQDDRENDANREPAATMEFFAIEPGVKVAELMAGRGYYAELLAHAVGETGKVFVHNNAFVIERFAQAPLSERLARLSLPQLTRVDAELNALPFEENSLDAVLMILFYHDTYWQKVDRATMNAHIYRSLRPGGIYGIVDHHAAAGAGVSVVESLHRVERQLVIDEVLAAGFVLEAESDHLAHPEDDRSLNVFDPSIRGKTDRFVLRFRK